MSTSEIWPKYQRSPQSIALPILAGFACLICIPPLITNVQARNFPTTVVVFGIVLWNVFACINALIWPTDDVSSWWNGYVLCDIEVKIYIGLETAIGGAIVCIFRKLAIILDTENTTLIPTPAQKRRHIAFDILFCILLPIYQMLAQYIVQPNRYAIYAISGCVPTVQESVVTLLILSIWPLMVCIIAFVYCTIGINRLVKYQRQISEIFSTSGSRMQKSRFFRLFAFSTVMMLVFIPTEAFTFIRNLASFHGSYDWSQVHHWQNHNPEITSRGTAIPSRWIQVSTGYAVWFFFGLGADATATYRRWLLKLGFDIVFPRLRPLDPVATLSRLTSGHTPLARHFGGDNQPTRSDSVPSNVTLSPVRPPSIRMEILASTNSKF